MTFDLYAILKVGASARQMRSAYRRLARAYHPDRHAAGDAAERFKRVAEAYAILSDTFRRAAYDRWGHAATSPHGNQQRRRRRLRLRMTGRA